MTAPERVWVGTAYGKQVGVDWSVEKAFEQDVCYIRADESDRLIAEAWGAANRIVAEYPNHREIAGFDWRAEIQSAFDRAKTGDKP